MDINNKFKQFVECDEDTKFTADEVCNLLGITKQNMAQALFEAVNKPFISDGVEHTFHKHIFNDGKEFTCDKTAIYLFALYLDDECKMFNDYVIGYND